MMHDMLCYQLKEERASARLVSSIAPICRRQLMLDVLDGKGIAKLIDACHRILSQKLGGIDHEPCEDADIIMPLDFETALTFRATEMKDLVVDLDEGD